MRARLTALLFDTLAKRLAWLMAATLIGSHLLAYGLFHLTAPAVPPPGWPPGAEPVARPGAPGQAGQSGHSGHSGQSGQSMTPLGPDSPGLGRPVERGGPGGPPPRLPTFPSLPPTPGLPDSAHRALPLPALLLDYGVRLAVIALAAWFGARWLGRPLNQLARASRDMAQTLRRGGRAPRLDAHAGTREVRELATAFNAMSEQLRQQFEGRALMVAAISHDLRTPITRLRMRLETQSDLERLRRQGVDDLREMAALIDSVLQVFQPVAAAPEPLRSCRLAALLQALVDDAQAQGQAVQLAAGSLELSARVPPLALRRVLDNLVGNALRYGQRARLRLRLEPDGGAGRACIEVDDDGPGIPPALLEAVFEPFVRVEASRHRASGGVGLGLHIARQLAEAMGARLQLQNRPEGGLRASLSLPVEAGRGTLGA